MKLSLNQIIPFQVASLGRRGGLDLDFDSSLPTIYGEDNENISLLIGNLVAEVYEHNSFSQSRVKTLKKGRRQVLELAWDGRELSPEKIRAINEAYERGGRLRGCDPGSGGTGMIGYLTAQLKGEVRIENFEDGAYRVRNILTLPLSD